MINKILDFIKEAEIDDITFYNDDFTQSVIVTMSKGLKNIKRFFRMILYVDPLIKN